MKAKAIGNYLVESWVYKNKLPSNHKFRSTLFSTGFNKHYNNLTYRINL